MHHASRLEGVIRRRHTLHPGLSPPGSWYYRAAANALPLCSSQPLPAGVAPWSGLANAWSRCVDNGDEAGWGGSGSRFFLVPHRGALQAEPPVLAGSVPEEVGPGEEGVDEERVADQK